MLKKQDLKDTNWFQITCFSVWIKIETFCNLQKVKRIKFHRVEGNVISLQGYYRYSTTLMPSRF